jgi:cyclase
MEATQTYSLEGADELAFLDIFATLENRKTRLEWIGKVCNVVTAPFAAGGGIGSVLGM